MPKSTNRQTAEQKIYHKWWMQIILAAVFLAIAYGFISLAIDSGSLLTYVVAILFLLWAVFYLKRGISQIVSK